MALLQLSYLIFTAGLLQALGDRNISTWMKQTKSLPRGVYLQGHATPRNYQLSSPNTQKLTSGVPGWRIHKAKVRREKTKGRGKRILAIHPYKGKKPLQRLTLKKKNALAKLWRIYANWKQKLSGQREKGLPLPPRWTKPENGHPHPPVPFC